MFTFVYNNRIREYSIETGLLVRNLARKNAKSGHYEGEEICKLYFDAHFRQREAPKI